MAVPFSLEVSRLGAATLVAPAGELDISTAPRLRRTLLELLHYERGSVVVDLDALTFMDSSGLAVIVAAYKRAKHEGLTFALCRPQPAVAKVLSITHVDRVIPVLDDPAAVPPPLVLVGEASATA